MINFSLAGKHGDGYFKIQKILITIKEVGKSTAYIKNVMKAIAANTCWKCCDHDYTIVRPLRIVNDSGKESTQHDNAASLYLYNSVGTKEEIWQVNLTVR